MNADALLTWPRWRVAMALALAAAALQAAPALLQGGDGVALTFALWLTQTPLQVLVLSAVFSFFVARNVGTTLLAATCLLFAVCIGAAFALGFVSARNDETVLVAGLGGVAGIVIAGIWAVAFVSPHVTARAERGRLEMEQLRLEAEQLRVAGELAALRSRLEPNFLFDTLRTIAALLTERPREARRLLGALGDLLRDSLDAREETQTLEREVTWLKRYAELFEPREVDLQWAIPSELGGVSLPRLVLQPLLEIALRQGGRVTVRAELSDDGSRLRCTVTPVAAAAPGLQSVRRQLELKYPGAALHVRSTIEGSSATVEVPVPLVVIP